MAKQSYYIVTYPIFSIALNERQKILIEEFLEKEIKGINTQDLTNIIEQNFHKEDMKALASEIKDEEERKLYFNIAKSIVELIDISKITLIGLSELGQALKIDTKNTGFDFDLYSIDAVNQYEYKKTVKSFSLIAGAVGFVPFIPIADFAILSSMQVGMISKIANIYDFKIEPQKFLQMLSGTIGLGILFKTTAKVLYNLIPLVGWFINASIAYSGTYAIGILAKRFIEANGELTKDSIKSIWEKSYQEGKEEFNSLKGYILKKKNELLNEIKKYSNKAEDLSEKNDDIEEFEKKSTTKKSKRST